MTVHALNLFYASSMHIVAYKTHRFVRDVNFTCIQIINLLYCFLVRPRLEHVSVIWSLIQVKYRQLLECMQHCFLGFVAFKLGRRMIATDRDYGPIVSKLKLRSLVATRTATDLISLHRLIDGKINCPQLLCLINFYPPTRSFWFTWAFLSGHYLSSLANSDSVHRFRSIGNSICATLDFFANSIDFFYKLFVQALVNTSLAD